MCFAMLKKTIFRNVLLAMLIFLPFVVHANSDSTRIGISVEIKSKQACDYSYALENAVNSENSKYTRFSDCGINARNLQQQANQIASSVFTTTQSQQDEKRIRVFMTVQ